MTFHVIALPHTQTTKEYLECAYTQKVIKFCQMMKSLGHTVYLYASEKNIAPCDELITCISLKEQKRLVTGWYISTPFDSSSELWSTFSNQAIVEIKKRIKPHDFICLIGGLAQKPIADAFPSHMNVEYGIGYGGVFSKYRVYESYAWMHTVNGSLNKDPHSINGRFFDTVIPNYFDISEFPFSDTKDDYYLYIGRIIDRKGFRIAQEVCKLMGKRLIVAGSGSFDGYGEYVGPVGVKERGELMSRAQAVFCPTLYIEPFGGVAVESMLCGTPVITTDWGAFTETIEQGKTGFRCRVLDEFCQATIQASLLDYAYIRDRAIRLYSTKTVALQYEKYFQQLLTLWDTGWYSNKEDYAK